MTKWFRLYNDFWHDPRIGALSESLQLTWVKTLCMASKSKNRGAIRFSDDEIAWVLRISIAEWQEAASSFIGAGLLRQDDSSYEVIDWEYDQKLRGRLPAHEWRRLRKQILERDNYTCVYCGDRAKVIHCDHVIPIARGGTNDPSNLVASCQRCNCSKHDKTADEWLDKGWNINS